MFSTALENVLPFSSNFKLSSANSLGLEESNICRLGKGQPNDKILHQSKLKALEDNRNKCDLNIEFLTMFSKCLFFSIVKTEDCVAKGDNSLLKDKSSDLSKSIWLNNGTSLRLIECFFTLFHSIDYSR